MCNQQSFLLTEQNVIDVFKKLTNQETVSKEEMESIKRRFFELVNV
jgi:hypothetical protein